MNTVLGLTESIEKSLETENYYAALAVAFALPDICGKLEFPEKSSTKRFKEWFDKYLQSKYQDIEGGRDHMIFLNASDCYSLRCSFLHEANDDITTQSAQKILSKIKFSTEKPHQIKIMDVLCLNVNVFCQDICEGVKSWLVDIDENQEIKERIDNLMKIEIGGFRTIPGVYVGNSMEEYQEEIKKFLEP
jgi:hypothetical protein